MKSEDDDHNGCQQGPYTHRSTSKQIGFNFLGLIQKDKFNMSLGWLLHNSTFLKKNYSFFDADSFKQTKVNIYLKMKVFHYFEWTQKAILVLLKDNRFFSSK